MTNRNREIATLGGGCFWCVEAIIQRLKGVEKVVSGYAGGETSNPDYRSICTGTTGHAEVVQVTFDPAVISYETLLTVFITSHDPTTVDRQGADRGSQYRSVIMYHNEGQKLIAEKVFAELQNSFENAIVTQLVPLNEFHRAEVFHQDYYNLNSGAGYCQVVINPKLAKLRRLYSEYLTEDHLELK